MTSINFSKKVHTKPFLRICAEALVISVIMVIILRVFVFIPYKVANHSMEPVLIGYSSGNDKILVNRLAYIFKKPERGDIILFKTDNISSKLKNKYSVKRLAGLPSEKVSINDNLIINNSKIPADFFMHHKYIFNPSKMKYGNPSAPFEVPKESYYVLGDNSENSTDSRYFGCIPKYNIVGKAFFIYWPLNRIGFIR